MAPSKKQYCPQGHDTFAVGRSSGGTCKACSSASRINWVRENKLWAITYKGEFCKDCDFDFAGRPECAQFDHRDGRRGVPTGRTITQLARSRLKAELDLCDLVCANCHAIRTLARLQQLTQAQRAEYGRPGAQARWGKKG